MPTYTQGLMDLGAEVCLQRKPRCEACPLAADCRARAQGRQLVLPLKTRRLKRGRREHWWLWLQAGEGADAAVWLDQRPARGVWAGLWTLPLCADEAAVQALAAGLIEGIQDCDAALGATGRVLVEVLPDIQHALTHFDWLLHPRRLRLDAAVARRPLGGVRAPGEAIEPGAGRWVALAELPQLALPAPLARLARTLPGG
jgi:A/G-specific adenine glycosylase